MSRDEAIQAINTGMDVVREIIEELKVKSEKLKVKEINYWTNNTGKTSGGTILGIGDMGIGNTTPSSAIIACLRGSTSSGKSVSEVTGRGTGIDDLMLNRKIQVIEKGLRINKPNPCDPIDVLAKVGGFEIAGLAGCVLQASAMKIPIVIDGFISTAGALIATELAPTAKEYIIASHNSQEIGHRVMLERMGLVPLFDLNLRLGEGTGAALGISLAEASIKILTQMATFESTGVSQEKQ
jgi:nicotinate-nucleotide--dimethylbenzimidazole phosphoribosyltransferase